MRYIQPTHVLCWAVWTKRTPQTNSSILYPTVAFQHTWLVFHVVLCFHFPQEKRFTGFQDICCKDEESLDQLIQNHTVLHKEYLIWMKSLANIYSINIGWMGENSACTWVAVLTLCYYKLEARSNKTTEVMMMTVWETLGDPGSQTSFPLLPWQAQPRLPQTSALIMAPDGHFAMLYTCIKWILSLNLTLSCSHLGFLYNLTGRATSKKWGIT